jgi:tungstate transport system ATP-binding protein
MPLAYELSHVIFSYDGSPALAVDRLDIHAGELVALVGPNGSGKTTLLHLLAFVLPPQAGRITFFGQTITPDRLIGFRRRTGLLLQHPYLFSMSVLGNVMWGLRIRGVSRSRSRELAFQALDWVGLSGFAKRDARGLSGGETQRVALARALVLDPEVLLLDEPANHMDRRAVEQVENIVQKLNAEGGKTVLFSSHASLSRSGLVPHRVLEMERGRLVV